MNAFESMYLESLATHGEFKAPTPALCERAFHWLSDIWHTENPHQLLDAFGDWIEDQGLYTTKTLQNVRGWACAVRFWLDLAESPYGLLRRGDEVQFYKLANIRVMRQLPEPVLRQPITREPVAFHPTEYDEFQQRRFLISDRRWLVQFRFPVRWYCQATGSRISASLNNVRNVLHHVDLITSAIRKSAAENMKRNEPPPAFDCTCIRFHNVAELLQMAALSRTTDWHRKNGKNGHVVFDETHIIDGFDI